MLLPSTVIYLVLLFSTTTIASPLLHLSSPRLPSNLSPSLESRQDISAPAPPPPNSTSILITGAVPAIECATPGRLVQYSPDKINTVILVFSKYLISQIPTTPDFTDFNAFRTRLPTTASAGIDPAQPPTYAWGCDAGKPMYWAPMSGSYGDDTDIVVMNLEGGVMRAGFCGVMTRADEGAEKKYHVCNQQPGT